MHCKHIGIIYFIKFIILTFLSNVILYYLQFVMILPAPLQTSKVRNLLSLIFKRDFLHVKIQGSLLLSIF